MDSCELQDLSKSQNKHHKKVMEHVIHCFIVNGKELSFYWLTTADIFVDVFMIGDLEQGDALNTMWQPVLSIDKCCYVTSLSTERTDFQVQLEASSCLRSLFAVFERLAFS